MSDQSIAEAVWRPILEKLRDANFKPLNRIDEIAPGVDADIAIRNVWYLVDHKLATANIKVNNFGRLFWYGQAAITAKGVDFLAEDGGLTKKLRTVTVELDATTLKALLVDHVDQQDAPEEEKTGIKHAIRSLPASGLKVLAEELVKRGMTAAPDLVHWLGTTLPHL